MLFLLGMAETACPKNWPKMNAFSQKAIDKYIKLNYFTFFTKIFDKYQNGQYICFMITKNIFILLKKRFDFLTRGVKTGPEF